MAPNPAPNLLALNGKRVLVTGASKGIGRGLVAAFAERFARFLQPPRHPKWRDVNLAAQVPGWTRFPPAQALLAGTAPAAVVTSRGS